MGYFSAYLLLCNLLFYYFFAATWQNKSIQIGFLSLIAVYKQFTGYGIGFLESYVKVILLKKQPEQAFPELFFTVKS